MFFFFNRVTDTLTYSGLTLTATSLAGNRFLNFFLDFGRIYFIRSGMHHASRYNQNFYKNQESYMYMYGQMQKDL